MSIDRSLRVKNALSRHRNVLSRAERLDMLMDQERWSQGDSVYGLPKVAHRKAAAGKKDKVEKVEGAEGAVAGAPAAAGAAPAGKAAPGAKAAAAAPAAKAAAPAAKAKK